MAEDELVGRRAVEESERDPRVHGMHDRALALHEQELPSEPYTFDRQPQNNWFDYGFR